MKRLIALTLFAALCRGQQSGVVFNHPTTAIQGVTIGATYCYFYAQLPAPGQVHSACWLNGTTVMLNHVDTVTSTEATGDFTFGIVNGACPTGVACGQISWIFSPGTAPNSINYSITGTVLPDPGMEPTESGTF